MSLEFGKKVAVITGAGRGLGRSYAFELARRGARVIVNDLGSSNDGQGSTGSIAQQLVDEIKAEGGEAVADSNDVSKEETAQKIIKTAIDRYGTVDILINNAGNLRDKSIMKMSTEDFDSVIKVHLYGTYFVTKAAYPVMRAKQYGRIVMTTSASALYGNFGQANYDAAKMGIVGFMNALKEEGKKYNILVNTIAPIADSRLGQGIFPPEVMKKIDPQYVTAMLTYLSSSECKVSGYIISCGGGFYTRVQIVEGEGYTFREGRVTPEMVAESFNLITDMNTKKHYTNSTEAITEMWRKITQVTN